MQPDAVAPSPCHPPWPCLPSRRSLPPPRAPARTPAARGFALLELAIASALAALAAVWAADAWVDRVEDAGARATAQWLVAVHQAMGHALALIEQHERGESAHALPPELATGPTLAGLKRLGYLDAGFPERSAWGHPLSIQVLRQAGCPGPGCRMDALVHTRVGAAGDDPGRQAERVGSVLLAADGLAGAVHAHAARRVRGPLFDLSNPPAAGMDALPAGSVALLVVGSPAQEDVHVRMRDTRDPQLQGGLTVAGAAGVAGNLSVAGRAAVGGGLEVGQDLHARSGLSVGRDLSVHGALSVAGTVGGQGRVVAGEYLQVRGRGAVGGPCPEAGLIGQDAAGTLLACNGSAWMAQGGQFGGAYVVHDRLGCFNARRQPSPNPRTGDCSCPAGYTPFLAARYFPDPIEDGTKLNAYICQR